ncbi:2-isopropylmalate synthase [Candidatus Woesearchaeota archaeon]|nr:2-isopropylmalate synthase [Candidatus Woesearchaeota archaeon]
MISAIRVFDTTLRDGEQSPGASMSVNEKLVIAAQLSKLGVDIIEAGFPIASKGDFEAVKLIAKKVRKPIICGLARCNKADIDAARDALKPAKRKRIHVFIATSDVHLKNKLRMSKEELKKKVYESVKYAKSFVDDIEFSPEDASRTSVEYMIEVAKTAIAAGATTINVPDTVGYAEPDEFAERIRHLREEIPDRITISVHCHNDLGMAVANSLAGVMAGATQIECCVNGLGERAGNASLEEVVMNLKTRKDFFRAQTRINTMEIFKTSKLVSSLTGIAVQRNKAIVGMNAFAHEAGIHQHGVITNKKTYEIMKPEDVGWEGENLVIGKHSGKHAVMEIISRFGFKVSEKQLKEIMGKIKDLADKKKDIHDDDIQAIALDVLNKLSEKEQRIKLSEISVLSGNRITPSATVGLVIDGKKKLGSAAGVGPVDAASKAILSITGPEVKLREYSLKAITGGTDALADVTIKLEDKNKNVFYSQAVNEDVIMASVQALIKGVNKTLTAKSVRRK